MGWGVHSPVRIKNFCSWKLQSFHHLEQKTFSVVLRPYTTSMQRPGELTPQSILYYKLDITLEISIILYHIFSALRSHLYFTVLYLILKKWYLYSFNDSMIHLLCSAVVDASCFLKQIITLGTDYIPDYSERMQVPSAGKAGFTWIFLQNLFNNLNFNYFFLQNKIKSSEYTKYFFVWID